MSWVLTARIWSHSSRIYVRLSVPTFWRPCHKLNPGWNKDYNAREMELLTSREYRESHFCASSIMTASSCFPSESRWSPESWNDRRWPGSVMITPRSSMQSLWIRMKHLIVWWSVEVFLEKGMCFTGRSRSKPSRDWSTWAVWRSSAFGTTILTRFFELASTETAMGMTHDDFPSPMFICSTCKNLKSVPVLTSLLSIRQQTNCEWGRDTKCGLTEFEPDEGDIVASATSTWLSRMEMFASISNNSQSQYLWGDQFDRGFLSKSEKSLEFRFASSTLSKCWSEATAMP